MTPSAIAWRCTRGDLWRRHRGAYVLGRASLTAFGENCAAALAVGARGALGHWSAAAALGAGAWPTMPQLVLLGGGVDLDGVEIHRTRALPESDISTNSTGIRATWWPRTTVDLAERCAPAELQTLLDRFERLSLLDVDVLQQAMTTGRRGLPKLHRALEPFTTIPTAEYLSLLERFAASILHPAGIDAEVNGRVALLDGASIRVDLLLRAQRVAIEVDGRDSHDRTGQFVTDRWRDRELQKLGFRVLRFTWHDVMYRPQHVLRDVRETLAAAA
jgi:hypothetical protein